MTDTTTKKAEKMLNDDRDFKCTKTTEIKTKIHKTETFSEHWLFLVILFSFYFVYQK